MCFGPELQLISAIGGTMVKAGAQAQAGAERQKQANEKAKQLEEDAQISALESKQKSIVMFEQYLQDSNANQAFFSYLGIEGSESIKAFEKRQKELINEQELRRRTQDTLQQAKFRSEANTLRASGRASLAAGHINAVSTIGSGIMGIGESTNLSSTLADIVVGPFDLAGSA